MVWQMRPGGRKRSFNAFRGFDNKGNGIFFYLLYVEKVFLKVYCFRYLEKSAQRLHDKINTPVVGKGSSCFIKL